jgi:hypothetical protein
MSCDVKLQLPGQNRDLARDVAAMANEGGVVIYVAIPPGATAAAVRFSNVNTTSPTWSGSSSDRPSTARCAGRRRSRQAPRPGGRGC